MNIQPLFQILRIISGCALLGGVVFGIFNKDAEIWGIFIGVFVGIAYAME